MWELARRLGESLKKMRLHEHLTQEAMAELLRIPTDTYIMIERGILLPSQPTFTTICKSLEPYPDHLMAFAAALLEPPEPSLSRSRRPVRDRILLRIRSRH